MDIPPQTDTDRGTDSRNTAKNDPDIWGDPLEELHRCACDSPICGFTVYSNDQESVERWAAGHMEIQAHTSSEEEL